MRQYLKTLVFFILMLGFVSPGYTKTIDFYFTVKRYLEVEQMQNYIEFNYLIPGNIPAYREIEPNAFQAELLLVVDIFNQKQESIFKHSYIIQSPIYGESPESLTNLSDVLNIPLEKDSVDLQIQVLDMNDSTAYFTDRVSLNILSNKEALLSDVALISSKAPGQPGDLYFKGAYVMVPKYINYYPHEVTQLKFYVEAYQKTEPKKYLIKYFISDENNIVLEKYSNFKKLSLSSFDALYAEFDISSLPSGNYYIYAELRDENNALVERKRMYFQRMNKLDEEDLDNVDYYELDVIKNNFAKKYDLRNITHHLNACKPIAEEFEAASIDGAVNSGDLSLMQNYFYSFWSKRDQKDPKARWLEYAEKVQYVDLEFGNSLIEGHETNRGYIYLKYGKPLVRLERNTSLYGFIEIWRYDILEGQGNIEFLFIERDTFDDEFQLVHSNLNNEMYSREWAQILRDNNF